MATTIRVFEHERLHVGERGFKKSHYEAILRYNERNNHRYFKVGLNKLEFTQFVGVVQVGNLCLEILPKADRNLDPNNESEQVKWHQYLIEMLRECRLLRIQSLTDAHLSLRSGNLFEVYLKAFISEVEVLHRHGLIKRYRSNSGNLPALKGRLDFARHLRYNLVHKERFYTEHTIYDRSNSFNRILRTALEILPGLTHSALISDRAARCLAEFPEMKRIKVSPSLFEGLHFDRKSEAYRPAILLAKMLLLNFFPDIKGGQDHVLALLFDMNRLFEEYVFRQMKKVEAEFGALVSRQERALFWESAGSTRTLVPDLVVKRGDETFVLDTKWKVTDSGKAAMSDLRQMFAYNHFFVCKRSLLLYPLTEGQEASEGMFLQEMKQEKHGCGMGFVRVADGKGLRKEALGREVFGLILSGQG